MQILPIYLYSNTLDVILDLDPTVRGVNQVMYQRDLTIQKGIKNQVRIQFKNSDQKKVSISNTQTFVFSMFDAIDQRQIIEKRLEVLEENTGTKGIALLTLSESDTVDLTRTSYKYTVKMQDDIREHYKSNRKTLMAITLALVTGIISVMANVFIKMFA